MMNFKYWAPLRFVSSDLLSQLRLAYVFGKNGTEVFIITENDDVFASGPNESCCLPYLTVKPLKVPELCGKNVKGFAYSQHDDGIFMCAYTADKTLYFWGRYFPCDAQATSSTSVPPITITKTPTLYENDEFGTKIVEVVASKSHCLLLTSDGKIFSFGSTKHVVGGKSRFHAGTPDLIEGKLTGKMITKISCGANFSVAIRDNGKVYAWGSNDHGQLGIGEENSDPKLQYKIRALTNVIIENIICGDSHVLAVSNFGVLYSWGKNQYGQLGLGDTTTRYTPVKVEKIGKVIDIAVAPYGLTSAAVNENNDVCMWGSCSHGEMFYKYPLKTHFNTLFDAFASAADPRIMHRPMLRTLELRSADIAENIRNSFGDSETSDLTIVADEKEIFVHKTILRIRSDYFKKLLQKPWLDEDKKVLRIDQNYEGLHAYLRYLYYGDFEGNPEIALESLKIAHEYHDLAWKKVCENHARRGITVENVANLYSLTLKLDTQDLAKACVLFAGKHIGDVIKTPDFCGWDADTLKQFITDCHKQKIILDQTCT